MKIKPNSHPARKTAKEEYQRFLRDTVDLFSGVNAGHMNPYAFNEPYPQIEEDPVRGGEYWENFVNASKHYYLFTEEAEVIESHARQAAGLLPANAICIDLGPGEKTAVLTKTLPLLQELKNVTAYIPVDINRSFVSTASETIMSKADIDSYGIVADFFQDKLDINTSNPRIMMLFGGLLCNLGKGHRPALDELSEALKLLRRHVRVSDFLVITQDINQDHATLAKAYNHPDLGNYVLTTLHKIKRDLPTQNFYPDDFEFYSEWHGDDHRQILGAKVGNLMTFRIDQHAFALRPGDKIPLVNCYKFPLEKFLTAARKAGFRSQRVFKSEQGRIALHILKAV